MKTITLEQKVKTLRKANPKLSKQDACTLLGVTLAEYNRSCVYGFKSEDNIFNVFDKFTKKKRNERKTI